MRVAENRNTPPEILRKLANSPEKSVRNSVARNPHTPEDVLKKMSE